MALTENNPALPATAGRLDRLVAWIARHWLPLGGLALALWVTLPWLAPVLMQLGWTTVGKFVYLVYQPFCHQLPQRSFFLFGPQASYDLELIQAIWRDTVDPIVLRQFVGSPDLGWKVAWSDRMVSMYSSPLLFGLLLWPWRRRLKPLSWLGLGLFLLPMLFDGGSHMVSDLLSGVGAGFRYDNQWLAILTGRAAPATFYAGDALGSFNSWLRLLTGLLFGLGLVWFILPRVGEPPDGPA